MRNLCRNNLKIDPAMPNNLSKTYCCVFGCKSSGKSSCSFHLFPKETEKVRVKYVNKRGDVEIISRRTAWILKLCMGTRVSNTMRVCSLHFKKEDFKLEGKFYTRNRLTRTAVPSQNLPAHGRLTRQQSPRNIQARSNRLANRTRSTIASGMSQTTSNKSEDVGKRRQKNETIQQKVPKIHPEDIWSFQQALSSENGILPLQYLLQPSAALCESCFGTVQCYSPLSYHVNGGNLLTKEATSASEKAN